MFTYTSKFELKSHWLHDIITPKNDTNKHINLAAIFTFRKSAKIENSSRWKMYRDFM